MRGENRTLALSGGSDSYKVDSLWTVLPPLPLKGVGTGMVESLDHYTFRLASRCGMARSRLALFLYRANDGSRTRSDKATHASWTGPASNYKNFLFPLIEYTAQTNLYKGTFHCVSEVLGRTGLVSSTSVYSRRRWCPVCYLTWDSNTSYEPLLWAFTMLGNCPLHDVQMEDRCSICNAIQPMNVRYQWRRQCRRCKSPLGHASAVNPIGAFQLWVDKSLHQFIEFVCTLEEVIPHAKIGEFYAALAIRLKQGEILPPAIKNYLNIVSKLQRDPIKSCPPSIIEYLNLAAFQGVKIEAILTSPSESAGSLLLDWGSDFTRVPFPAVRLSTNLKTIARCINQFLASPNILLPPVKFLCKVFKVNAVMLKEHLPDRHQLYRDRQSKQWGAFTEVHYLRALASAITVVGACTNNSASGRMLASGNIVIRQANVSRATAAHSIAAARIIVRLQKSVVILSDQSASFDKIAEGWMQEKES